MIDNETKVPTIASLDTVGTWLQKKFELLHKVIFSFEADDDNFFLVKVVVRCDCNFHCFVRKACRTINMNCSCLCMMIKDNENETSSSAAVMHHSDQLVLPIRVSRLSFSESFHPGSGCVVFI